MLNRLSFNLIKTSLGFLVCLNCIHSLNQKSHAATLHLFSETTDPVSIQQSVPRQFLDGDLLSQLIPIEEGATAFNDPINSQTITQGISEPSSVSVDSVLSSLGEVRFDMEREALTIDDIPILSQVDAADVYKDIYDFGTTPAQETSDPVSVGDLSPLEVLLAPTPTGGIRTTGNRVGAIPRPNLSQPTLPRFGGPVGILTGPSRQYAAPLSQVNLPSPTSVQAGNWGDSQVDVSFTSFPKQEVVDIDTFVRTVYRTNLSDAIKQIDASLDLTIDANFSSMPASVFPSKPMPSGRFKQNL